MKFIYFDEIKEFRKEDWEMMVAKLAKDGRTFLPFTGAIKPKIDWRSYDAFPCAPGFPVTDF